jgi:hypothetical protein
MNSYILFRIKHTTCFFPLEFGFELCKKWKSIEAKSASEELRSLHDSYLYSHLFVLVYPSKEGLILIYGKYSDKRIVCSDCKDEVACPP